jgi:hypothetical protein
MGVGKATASFRWTYRWRKSVADFWGEMCKSTLEITKIGRLER